MKEKPLVRSAVLCEYENRLSGFIEAGLLDGYQIACPIIFTGYREPSGTNGYAVGFKWEHFLVVMIRKEAAA